MTDPTISPHEPPLSGVLGEIELAKAFSSKAVKGTLDYCAARIRELEAEVENLLSRCAKKAMDCDALRAEKEKLREALRNARRYIAVDASNRGYQWAVDLRAEIDTALATAECEN